MRTIVLIAFILLNFVSFAQAETRRGGPDSSVGNGKYLSINKRVRCKIDRKSPERCLPNKQLIWQKQEVSKWENAIRKAADMLPQEFFSETGKISWDFFIDREDWATAVAHRNDSWVEINLLSKYKNPPKWMVWEPLRKNGLNEVVRKFVALHEMAHIYSLGSELNVLDEWHVEFLIWAKWDWNKNTKQFILSSGVEENNVVIAKEIEVTLYSKEKGRQEDFAEAFALYIMWPEYLKEHFPLHYDVIKEILVVEYESVYPMTSSIKTKLTVR